MEELNQITSAAVAAAMLHEQMHDLDHEEVWIIYLNSIFIPIGTEMVSKGTLTETSIDCRTVLRHALLHNAAALILLHNHPSGNPKPSQQDIHFTDQLRKACLLIDIRLVDHIITSKKSFYSFIEEKVFTY